jgi:hypothetical protein
MNDKIKELLENAEKSDAIARNKWRIENREQLREERKQKLKELMEKDKQKTAVEWQFEQLFNSFEKFNNGEYTFDEYLKRNLEIREQAKEMEKHRMIKFTNEWFEEYQCGLGNFKNPEKYYNETYGGGEQ